MEDDYGVRWGFVNMADIWHSLKTKKIFFFGEKEILKNTFLVDMHKIVKKIENVKKKKKQQKSQFDHIRPPAEGLGWLQYIAGKFFYKVPRIFFGSLSFLVTFSKYLLHTFLQNVTIVIPTSSEIMAILSNLIGKILTNSLQNDYDLKFW